MLSLNDIEVIKEQSYACFPSQLSNVCEVYPLKMEEIIKMGSDKYKGYLNLLLLTEAEIAKMIEEKTKIEVDLSEITTLSYLLQSAKLSDSFLLDLQNAFTTFIKEEVLLLPKINAVLIGNDFSKKRLITEKNFSDFQDILRIQNRRPIEEPPPENESPIAKKFRLKREMRDAVKKKQQQKNGTGLSTCDLLGIAETFHIDWRNCSVYSFYVLLERHQLKEKWQQDIQMLCAGADSQKLKTKYWGESLDKKDE